jgi:hypothetical protein
MAEQFSWTLNVQVASGPKVLAAGSNSFEAYDKITATIPAEEATGIKVDVEPGGDGQVKFLLIRSTVYSPDLTYDVTDGATGVKLDSLQLLMGDGAIELLGAAPKELTFKNAGDKPAAIEILVGRKAVPPGP